MEETTKKVMGEWKKKKGGISLRVGWVKRLSSNLHASYEGPKLQGRRRPILGSLSWVGELLNGRE